jgi:hypothetical protein
MGYPSLNPTGVTVVHADTFGDGTPLCGWIGDEETATTEVTDITCRDCLAAMVNGEGKG